MNLLDIRDGSIVSKTSLSRKLTIGGVTKAYSVYKIRLDQLMYNDQNDRIATWITQYKNNSSNVSLSKLDIDEYNDIIEKFIVDSNPAAIERTKNNIALVNQREPGVVLSDGRIIDGNRRFTCLRMLHREDPSVNYFETVILDSSVQDNEKQVKMLELAIQHGEEQRVDYNSIDMAIGAYHDVIETNLLTIEEYASSTNEQLSDVKRRLATAQLIIDFLDFMNVPKQYHIAREMQVYSLFVDVVPLLRRCETEESKTSLKRIIFTNTMMDSIKDERKYVREVKSMMDSGLYQSYAKKQERLAQELEEKKDVADIHDRQTLKEFVIENEDLTEELQVSTDRSLLQSKKAKAKSMPSQIVNKSISMLKDIDMGIVDRLSDEEKNKLGNQLYKLSNAVSLIKDGVVDEPPTKKVTVKTNTNVAEKEDKLIKLAKMHRNEPYVYCTNERLAITNLAFTFDFTAIKLLDSQNDIVNYMAYFVNDKNEALCEQQRVCVSVGEITRINFSLNSSASSLKKCYLVLRSANDAEDEAQNITEVKINISFNVEFDF